MVREVNLKAILLGSTLLGSGGGGTLKKALELVDKFLKDDTVTLLEKIDIKSNKFYGTFYFLGALDKPPEKGFIRILDIYKKVFNIDIHGIIPVEIGPVIIAASAALKKPLIDFDFSYSRAIPTVDLELQEVEEGLTRTPLIGKRENEIVLIDEEISGKEIEERLTDFYTKNGKVAISVLGYPTLGKVLSKFKFGSLSKCEKIGKSLEEGRKPKVFKTIGRGVVIEKLRFPDERFYKGIVRIRGEEGVFEIPFVNEFMMVKRESEIIEKAPNVISLLEIKKNIGMTSLEVLRGMEVEILTLKLEISEKIRELWDNFLRKFEWYLNLTKENKYFTTK